MVGKTTTLDTETLTQLLGMQEDLNEGLGRRKSKASVELHDYRKIEFPARYLTASGKTQFSLRGSTAKSMEEYLENIKVRRDLYEPFLQSKKFPVLVDSTGEIISLACFGGSERTNINTESRDIFVEVTGFNLQTLFDILAILVFNMSDMNFVIESVNIKLNDKMIKCPSMQTKQFKGLKVSKVNKVLGLKLNLNDILNCLKKSRLDGKANSSGIDCSVPRYRTDIIGHIDLIEDISLGYGINNLEPTIPSFAEPGRRNHKSFFFEKIKMILIGMGLVENLNFNLTSRKLQQEFMNIGDRMDNIIEVAESKSFEHNILRISLLPSLLESLSHNIHEEYPQKLFEAGQVFLRLEKPNERWMIAGLTAHKDASYTEIKSIVQTLMAIGIQKKFQTLPSFNAVFLEGRAADLYIGDLRIGNLGEIHPSVIANFKIRVPIAGFEIDLSPIMDAQKANSTQKS